MKNEKLVLLIAELFIETDSDDIFIYFFPFLLHCMAMIFRSCFWTVKVLHSGWIIQTEAWNLWLHNMGTWIKCFTVLDWPVISYTSTSRPFPISKHYAIFLLYFFPLSSFWPTHASFCHQFGSLLVYMSHDCLNSFSRSLKSKWWETHFLFLI